MKKGSSGPKRPRLDSGTWSMLLEVQQESDLSVKDFCASQGISPATFYQRRKRLDRDKGGGVEFFSPIELRTKPLCVGISVELPGGVVLRFEGLPPVDYLRDLSSKFSEF